VPGDHIAATFSANSTPNASWANLDGLATLAQLCQARYQHAIIQRNLERRFNAEYQDLYDKVPTTLIQLEERQQALSNLRNEFEIFARISAELIIVQQQLPESMRVIQPNDQIGGSAGGEKYIVGHVLFKFARDWHNIYGMLYSKVMLRWQSGIDILVLCSCFVFATFIRIGLGCFKSCICGSSIFAICHRFTGKK
jgi:hypothetical protein